MKYNLAFFTVPLIFLLFFSFWLDIKPCYLELQHVHNEGNNLIQLYHQEIQLIKEESQFKTQLFEMLDEGFPSSHQEKPYIMNEWIASILKNSTITGMVIDFVRPEVWKVELGMNKLSIFLLIHGQFSQWVEFIAMLERLSLPLKLNDFEIQMDEDKKLHIKLKLIGYYFPMLQPVLINKKYKDPSFFSITQDPFQSFTSDKIVELNNGQLNLTSHAVSIKYLKFVGYIQQQKNYWAIILLPNGKTISIAENASLGLEGFRVLSITPEKILAKLNDRQFILPYFSKLSSK